MPDELNPGQPVTVAQTTAYALPPTVVWVASDTAVDVGMSTGTTGWTALTGANTVGAATSMLYVRCTASTNAVVVVKRLS